MKKFLTPDVVKWIVGMIFLAGMAYSTMASKTYVDSSCDKLRQETNDRLDKIDQKLDRLILTQLQKGR